MTVQKEKAQTLGIFIAIVIVCSLLAAATTFMYVRNTPISAQAVRDADQAAESAETAAISARKAAEATAETANSAANSAKATAKAAKDASNSSVRIPQK